MKGTTKRGRFGQSIAQTDVKVCGLCGSLNLRSNAECFTCGWHGEFIEEASCVNAAWRSLEAEYGSLQREHVSGVTASLLSAFELVSAADEPPPPKPWPPRLPGWLRSRQ